MRWPIAALGNGVAVLALAAVLASSAPASATADDVSVFVSLGIQGGRSLERKTDPNFHIVVGVETVSAVLQTVTVSVGLPDGLRWADGLDRAEGCAGTAPVRCTGTLEPGVAGTVGVGWYLGVLAERPGFYEITATVDPTEPDPNRSNNSHTFRFEVVALGGGGGTAISASGVKLTPAKPKAGSVVTASVRVTAGGFPVRPTRVACGATLGGAKVKGTPRAASGAASCSYRTPQVAKGKRLKGAVSFTARGTRFTRRFAARLG